MYYSHKLLTKIISYILVTHAINVVAVVPSVFLKVNFLKAYINKDLYIIIIMYYILYINCYILYFIRYLNIIFNIL